MSLQARKAFWGLAAERAFLARKHLPVSSQHKASTSVHVYRKQLKTCCAACLWQPVTMTTRTNPAGPAEKSLPPKCSVCFLHCLYPSRIFIEHDHWDVHSPVMVAWQVFKQHSHARSNSLWKRKYFHLSQVLGCPWNWSLQISWASSAIWGRKNTVVKVFLRDSQTGIWPGVTSMSLLIMFPYKQKGHLAVTGTRCFQTKSLQGCWLSEKAGLWN